MGRSHCKMNYTELFTTFSKRQNQCQSIQDSDIIQHGDTSDRYSVIKMWGNLFMVRPDQEHQDLD